MEYKIGTVVLDGWEIVRRIGEGAYGEVFEIRKAAFGVEVASALKVIRVPKTETELRSAYSDGMDERSATSYFQEIVDEIVQEIRIMSMLKAHPDVISCEDFAVNKYPDQVRWDILIRMELLTPLVDLTLQRELTQEEILRLGIEVSDALAHCHEKNLIHRDVKPENIFMDELGHFKLGDFGIARTLEKSTGGMSSKGTESYMAPEVYLNHDYDQSVDSYSLGLVLYRYLNRNRLPFMPQGAITPTDRTDAILRRVKGEALPAIPGLDDGLNDILRTACAHRARDRYRSAGELRDALEAYAQEKHISWRVRSAAPAPEPEIQREEAEDDLTRSRVMSENDSADESEVDEPADIPEPTPGTDTVARYFSGQESNSDAASFREIKDEPVQETQKDAGRKRRSHPALVVTALLLLIAAGAGIWAGTQSPDGDLTYLQHIAQLFDPKFETPYTFIEPAIEAAVREELDASTRTIFPSDLLRITTLSASQQGITSVEDLRGMTNLTYLKLANNNISDISALSELTGLTTLDLGNNDILDISALSGLTKLTTLDLNSNNIKNISALRGLTKLAYLNLSENNIFDINALSELTNMTFLNLSGNNISGILALRGMTNLTALYLNWNNIHDISALSGLTNLETIWLDESITDLRPVKDLNVTIFYG